MLSKISIIITILLCLIINSSCENKKPEVDSTDGNKNSINEQKQDDPQLLNKGLTLLAQKKYEEAIKCFDNILESNSKSKNGWYYKGFALYNQKKYEEAIKCYDKVLEITPNNDDVWYGKGDCLSKLGKYEEAIKCFDKAIQINPNLTVAKDNKAKALKALGK